MSFTSRILIICGSSLCTTVFSELKTVDVGPILDIDLTLYKLTYDKDKGQSLRNFPEKDGFSASQVDMRGMESAERIGQAYIAVDGPLYRMAYCLHIPKLQFFFSQIDIPEIGSYTDALISSPENKMHRFLEYTPLKNGKCIVSDGVVWSDISSAQLQVAGNPPKDISDFFNSTFRDALNSRSGYFNRELDYQKCKEFTTPFTTVFV